MSDRPSVRSRRIIVGISGASGAVFGVRALELLRAIDDVETHLVMTPAAKMTLAHETNLAVEEVEGIADHVHSVKNVGAPIASGSFASVGMIVAPCSIKTLSAVANSYSADLLVRAADVTLKERRPLVLMVRETPLHIGHLRLCAQAAESGAVIYPPVPAMYSRPATIDELVTHSVVRALEHLGVDAGPIPRWGE